MCYFVDKKHANLIQQSGFTLVELMVALVLGLFVVLGATQLFLASSQSFRSVENINKRQVVVSYFSNIIAFEVRAARRVSPVGTGGGEVGDSDRLKIEFDVLSEYNPYCPSVDDNMIGVEYFVDSENASLIVQANCGDPSGPEANQEVLRGVSDIRFLTDKVGTYVDVVITLEPSGSPPSSDVISMRFARHNSDVFSG